MNISQDIKDRITVAADALYEELGRSEFPTVAAVRSRAATDMNAASIVMRQWRRAQTTQSAPVAVDIPDKVRTAHSVALASLWSEAQAVANTGLSAAQAAWDTERAEAEALRGELSDAFEAQHRDLQTAQAQIARHIEQQTHQQAQSEALRAELAQVSQRAGTAEARAIEIERRANDLASELQRLHADLASTQATAQAERQQHTEQRKQSAQEALRVAQKMTQAEADRDQERREAGKAREEAARLQGMVQAMTSQNAELMRAMAGVTGAVPSTGPAPGPGKKKDQ